MGLGFGVSKRPVVAADRVVAMGEAAPRVIGAGLWGRGWSARKDGKAGRGGYAGDGEVAASRGRMGREQRSLPARSRMTVAGTP